MQWILQEKMTAGKDADPRYSQTVILFNLRGRNK